MYTPRKGLCFSLSMQSCYRHLSERCGHKPDQSAAILDTDYTEEPQGGLRKTSEGPHFLLTSLPRNTLESLAPFHFFAVS